MLVGHNPGLEDLALLLIGNGDLDARRRLHTKFPTAGLCVIDLPQQGWAALHPGGGRLERFVTPKMLGADPD
jgi:phosphohistidine phosphatase